VHIPKSLKPVTQRKLTPSQWHEEHRLMDDNLLHLRLLHERNTRSDGVEHAVKELGLFFDEAMNHYLSCINKLINGDMEEFKTANTTKTSYSTCSTESPATKLGHFTYSLLDLVQQNIDLLYSEPRFKMLVGMALHVARASPRSFLRCKAFELLVCIGNLQGVGTLKVEREVEQTLKADTLSRWAGSVKKIHDQWRGMKLRGGEADKFRAQLSSITVDYVPVDIQVRAALC
jgi:hypothetical protein